MKYNIFVRLKSYSLTFSNKNENCLNRQRYFTFFKLNNTFKQTWGKMFPTLKLFNIFTPPILLKMSKEFISSENRITHIKIHFMRCNDFLGFSRRANLILLH